MYCVRSVCGSRSSRFATSSATVIPSRPAGAWTLNNDLSDQAGSGDQRDQGDGERGRGDGGRRGPGGGGGRRGGGGFGGGRGGGRGGGMGRGAGINPEDMARMRDAMRDL